MVEVQNFAILYDTVLNTELLMAARYWTWFYWFASDLFEAQFLFDADIVEDFAGMVDAKLDFVIEVVIGIVYFICFYGFLPYFGLH